MKNPSNSTTDHVRWSRKLFASMLWRAFPGRSEAEIAARAAPVLGVSERQVRNWLRIEHSAALHHFLAVAEITSRADPQIGVSERQARDLLRAEHSAAPHHFLAVAAIAVAEIVIASRSPIPRCPDGSTTLPAAGPKPKPGAR